MAEPKTIAKRAIAAFLGVVLVVFVGKQLSGLVSAAFDTETALAVNVSKTVETDGYILRDETLLYSNISGIMLASVPDGTRLSKGQEAVRVYSKENDVSVENELRIIDEKIQVLKKSIVDTTISSQDLTKTDEVVGDMLSSSAVYSTNNDFVGALSKKNEILVEMNKRWLVSNPNEDFSDEISLLENRKTSLKNRLSGEASVVYAQQSGYYYSNPDGYERIFSAKDAQRFTFESFSEMIKSDAEVLSGNVCGKLVNDYVWYTGCVIDRETADKFNVGDVFPVEFSYAYGTCIEMKLELKKEDDSGNKAFLLFSTGKMPEGFDYMRKQKIIIAYETYSGLKIPKNSVRISQDLKGVYVLVGNEVQFKLINEIYSLEDAYIVDMNTENYPSVHKRTEYYTAIDKDGNETEHEKQIFYEPLSLYDKVICGSGEYYDGMRIG